MTEVQPGATYSWPDCFAERGALRRDPTFDGAPDCRDVTRPSVELAPHAAPLGLAFYTRAQFPAEYVGDLFVALHGSRLGLVPSGYAIARVRFRDGRPTAIVDHGKAIPELIG